jgi:hypothetical protein
VNVLGPGLYYLINVFTGEKLFMGRIEVIGGVERE